MTDLSSKGRHHYEYHSSHRSNRSHDADRRKEQFSKPKESKLDTSTSSSKHSIVECNKSDIQKSVDSSEVISNQVPATTNTKPKGPPAAVLASVAAVMASIKAQQPSESVLNRISIQQPNSLQPTDIPKYYNAKMVNAAKLAQQAEKRKLLWGDNKSSANEKVINDELHFFHYFEHWLFDFRLNLHRQHQPTYGRILNFKVNMVWQ